MNLFAFARAFRSKSAEQKPLLSKPVLVTVPV